MQKTLSLTKTCPECGTEIYAHTDLSRWINAQRHPLDSSLNSLTDVDYVWHNFKEDWFIIIEEKCYNTYPDLPQQDTLGLLVQMCLLSRNKPINTHIYPQTKTIVDFRGFYLLSLSATSPVNSRYVTINGVKFDRYTYNMKFTPDKAIEYLLTHGMIPGVNRLPNWKVFDTYPKKWNDSQGVYT